MAAVLLLARLVLAAVFGVAGIAKLADRPGVSRALAEFGVPAGLAPLLSVLLPLAELAVAVALLPATSATGAAAGALVLLLAFTTAIAASLARGQRPHCHCFGQLASGPIGGPTLLRNLLLTGLAILIVWGGRRGLQPGVLEASRAITPEQVAMAQVALVPVLLVLAILLLLQIVRQQGRILLRLEAVEARVAVAPAGPVAEGAQHAGLPIGAHAPAFRLRDFAGKTHTLPDLLGHGHPLLLLFLHPDCGPCRILMPEVANWQRDHGGSLTMAIVSEGSARHNRQTSREFGLTHVLVQRKREVAEAYQAYGTPGAVLVRSDGTIGSHVAMGADAVRSLAMHLLSPSGVGQAVAPGLPDLSGVPDGAGPDGIIPVVPAPPRIGDPAPRFELPDLSGASVSLAMFGGRETVVLFWNPQCGFCQGMLPRLKDWEARAASDPRRLVLVSTGTAEANRLMGLRSPVLLDPQFRTASAFGAGGTPTAVSVDAEGRVQSELAVGADAVLALLDGSALPSRSPSGL